jgi:methionyl-tRNA formyltransferase
VKTTATSLGLDVAQPESGSDLLDSLEKHAPFDVAVVVAYGRILSREALAVPTHGMLNVHFSLLPRWRGAAPVNRAIIAGDPMTGVTIIRLDEGLDTGPVLTAQAVDIARGEDAGSLTARLAELGARLLVDNLTPYLEGTLTPVAQTDDGATYAKKLETVDRPLSLDDAPDEFVRHVRGLAPEPAATLIVDGESHKILAAEPVDAAVDPGKWELIDGWPVVGLAGGAVRISRLQPPGKKAMSADDWARGRPASSGAVA